MKETQHAGKGVCVCLDKHSPYVSDREGKREREIYNNRSHNSLLPLKPPPSCHYFFRSSISTFMSISVSVFVYMSTVDVWFGASMWKKIYE